MADAADHDGSQPGRADPDEVSGWVAAARAGDRHAFDALVRHTYLDTYTLAYRLTGDEEDARDVVQESYLRAYRGLRRFRGEAQFSTWLYRITANCASTELGRRARHRHDDLDEEWVDANGRGPSGPELAADNAALRARLETALGELPPRLRAVVVLRDIYDLPHDAIAAELGISVSAAKVRLHRARRRLRQDLFVPPAEIADPAGRAELAAGQEGGSIGPEEDARAV